MPKARICVVTDANILTVKLGSSQYFDQIARMLVADGADLHLLWLNVHAPGVIRIPEGSLREYARSYASVEMFQTVNVGGSLYSTRPSRWLSRVQRFPRPYVEVSKRWLAAPDPASIEWAVSRIRALRPDAVIANYFNATAVFPKLERSLPKILVAHDIVALRASSFASAGFAPDFDESILNEEANALARVDLTLVIKDSERNYVLSQDPHANVLTVPMTSEPDVKVDKAPRPPVALFVGGAFAANAEGLKWLLREVWPLVSTRMPEARLRVIGRVAGTPGLTWPAGAEPAGYVDDIAAEYAGATVALAPLLFGSGVKIKVIEAFTYGLPVVATNCGGDGIDGTPPSVLTRADDPVAFASAIVARFVDPDAPQIRENARAYAASTFDRDRIGGQLNDRIADLLRNRSSSFATQQISRSPQRD